jgi:hypothetical protein
MLSMQKGMCIRRLIVGQRKRFAGYIHAARHVEPYPSRLFKGFAPQVRNQIEFPRWSVLERSVVARRANVHGLAHSPGCTASSCGMAVPAYTPPPPPYDLENLIGGRAAISSLSAELQASLASLQTILQQVQLVNHAGNCCAWVAFMHLECSWA